MPSHGKASGFALKMTFEMQWFSGVGAGGLPRFGLS
jgi:hypothetical protein